MGMTFRTGWRKLKIALWGMVEELARLSSTKDSEGTIVYASHIPREARTSWGALPAHSPPSNYDDIPSQVLDAQVSDSLPRIA